MEINPATATAINETDVNRPTPANNAALRKMATEFEALLLNQLTASMNGSENDEDGLFSNSGGMGLSRQMFNEQIAKTIAQNGGIGLADLIMSQLNRNKPTTNEKPELTKSVTSAVREIRNETKNPAAKAVESAVPESSNVRFIASEAALATRPRRVHPVAQHSSVGTDTPVSETRSVSPAPVSKVLKVSDNGLSAPVALQLPAPGVIRSVFGPRRDPINGRPRFHQGIDIAAPKGTPIQAAAAGTVVFSGRNKGYGNMVMIEHADGRRTLYAHAEKLFVQVGTEVAAGETIAAVGSTGHSTGPHVHFEIRVGNQAVNPLTALANDFTLARR